MRDFEKEYKNYIQEDVPDLWERIEAGISGKIISERENDIFLKRDEKINENEQIIANEADKKQDAEKSSDRSKTLLYFVKRSIPAVAALCVLIIGIGAIRISNRAKSENAAYEPAAVTEDACDEAPVAGCEASVVEDDFTEEEAAAEYAEAEEDAGYEENLVGDVYDTAAAEVQEAAKNTEAMSDEATAGIQTNDAASSKENENTLMTDADGIVTIHAATLTGIGMADSDLQDEGFAYVYRFVLADGNRMEMYLTREQCDALEADRILVERQKQYELEVRPYTLDETDSGANTSAKCVLVNMRED